MVYVIHKDGHAIQPTKNHAKVRHLLKTGKAKVIKRCPFTIQLLYNSTAYVKEVTMGMDSGSKHIGIANTTKEEDLLDAEVELRDDIVELLSTKRELRRSRRYRKTRYRKPRFDNRVKTKHKGWLAPSVQHKVDTHLQMVEKMRDILPIKNIVVEVASFDLQRLKADIQNLEKPEGTDYQQGEQLGFWNVREYVLYRDGHKCQCCKGKSKDKVLNVHHIESRKTGGNAPGNLITLCEYCHDQYHKGNIKLPASIKRQASLRDATFMGIMRWALYEKLKEIYEPLGIKVNLTYGYITKNTRIENKLPKEHYIDARCISGNPNVQGTGYVYHYKKVRCHNRQIHKCKISKDGLRKRNQAPYEVKGFRLFDKVIYKEQECFIFGRRESGYFDIRKLDGTKISASVSYKQLELVETRKSFLTERRPA